MPQTPTAQWREMLDENLAPDETVDQVHEALVHTLGNLTLTGYNSALSNSSFAEKRELLLTSGLAMNQEIAACSRCVSGQLEIDARAEILADRIASIWPAPTAVTAETLDPEWNILFRALAAIPAGAWTTYGDLGTLIGAHPIAIGTRLAAYPLPNAHRVLQVSGKVAEGFRWLDPDRSDNPRDILEAEGVTFNDVTARTRSNALASSTLPSSPV